MTNSHSSGTNPSGSTHRPGSQPSRRDPWAALETLLQTLTEGADTTRKIEARFGAETGQQFDPVVVKAFVAVRHEIYPPIYQKGIGDSAFHVVDHLVTDTTEITAAKLPTQTAEPPRS